jgi:hypothetical protein
LFSKKEPIKMNRKGYCFLNIQSENSEALNSIPSITKKEKMLHKGKIMLLPSMTKMYVGCFLKE